LEDDLLKDENERLATLLEYGLEPYKNKWDIWGSDHMFLEQLNSVQEVNKFLKKEYDKKFK